MSNPAEQIREALSMFARNGTEPALIGGLAVVTHHVVRATKNVDFLVEAETANKVNDALLDLGYQCMYRSDDARFRERCNANARPGRHSRIIENTPR